MSFCFSGKGFARPLFLFIVPFILLMAWLILVMPAVPAQAMSRPPTPASLDNPKDVEAFLDGVLASELTNNHIVGATVSIVKDGHVLLDKGYGYADQQQGKKVIADNTLFRLGSISKLFTWTALMQLEEEGKIDLHADINTYLKTFRIPATYPQPITIEHLMTHTAGFEDDNLGQMAPQASDLEPLGVWLPKHIPARIRPPGVVTSYSNYGATLAGYIVEQVSGMPFEQYIERHIFQPLEMNQSTFRQPLPAPLSEQLSQGYTYTNEIYHTGPFENIQVTPAASLSSTATDMANFMIAQLQLGHFGSTRILQEATAKLMQQQHFANDPRLPGMAYGFFEQQTNNLHLIGHVGDTLLFHSLMMLLPQQHVGLFISFNSADGGAHNRVLQAFLDRYYSVSKTETVGPLTGYAERSSQIEGSYWETRRNETTYQKVFALLRSVTVSASGNGHLMITSGGTEVDFMEIKPWVFKQTNGSDMAVFHGTDNGMSMFDGPYQAYQKMAWYEAPPFQIGLLLICQSLFSISLLVWSFRLVRGIRKKISGKPLVGGIRSELPRWCGGIVSILNIIVLVGFPISVSNLIPFFTPPALVAVMVLASIAAAFALGAIICSILVWRIRSWSRWQCLSYVPLALAALFFSADLNFWHLLWLPF